MKCEILWNNFTVQEWQNHYAGICRSNILQSPLYGFAQARTMGQKVRWGVIVINGQSAGIVQILEAKILWGLVHGLILDRGPLWFDGFGGAAHIKIFFEEFNCQFPKRFGRKRRILPEVEDGPAALQILKSAGLIRKIDQSAHESLWWNLEQDDEAARKSLKENWHGSLKKAQRSELEILWDHQGNFFPFLREKYLEDKTLRGYGGISPKLLDNLAMISPDSPFMLIGKARKNNEYIATIMILMHGQSATYQIGWTNDAGRQYCAHHLLLWHARQVLQGYGIKDLDLGGVNQEASALGIRKFKEGTGAKFYKLIGHYD